MRIHIIRMRFDDLFGRRFGVAHVARHAEIELGQAVLELRRSRIRVDRVLVLVNRVLNVFRTPRVDRFFFVHVGHGGVEISRAAIRRLARFRARIRRRFIRRRGGLAVG